MARTERFSKAPCAVGVPSGKPRLSMMDRQIASLRAEREREQMAIRTREELFEDLTDFSHLDTVDEYGLPIRTSYQIPDSIPDMLPLPQKDPAQTTPEEVIPSSVPPSSEQI